MFGYLKPYKPEMKMKEYECYKGFYCGLCRTLKKEYGLFSTFALSYDAAFLALLYKAMGSESPSEFKRKRCIGCPLKKCTMVMENKALKFAADVLVLMVYFKIKDAFSDHGVGEKIKYSLLYPFFVKYKNKAKKRSLMLYDIIEEGIERTASAEKKNASADEAADGTAYMLGSILEIMPGDREKNYRFGYMLGRFIYLCDAADDLEKDKKRGNFNPFKGIEKGNIEELLKLSVSGVISSYEGIEVYDMQAISDNLIYLGLPEVIRTIVERKEK